MPVLSKTTAFTLCKCSRASADLKITPFLAPTPVPTIIATGVARPNAHGQEITKTVIALDKAKEKSLPSISHTIKVIIDIQSTTGTNTPATLSASLAIGAFDALASSTSLIICESVVSFPTLVALKVKYPPLLIDADITVSFIVLSTGKLSPVSADSSKTALPEIIVPSTGTL